MAGNYKKYFGHRVGALSDIILHYKEIRKQYSDVSYKINRNHVEICMKLQPTEYSCRYTVKIVARQGSKDVRVFVVEPDLRLAAGDRKIPHLYSDGSLCLYYPKNHEWSYQDSWAETLVPWICLWLYYFEFWLAIGEWLGGGIHPGEEKVENNHEDEKWPG